MRTTEQHDGRQLALRERLERARREKSEPALKGDNLTIAECARRLNCAVSTAWKIFSRREGVLRPLVPGRRKPMIRVPLSVFEAYVRESTNPGPRRALATEPGRIHRI